MADNRQSQNELNSPSPLPCANGCGFFGSPSTMNMCSKCFRENQRTSPQTTQQQQPSPSPSPSPPTTSIDNIDCLSSDNLQSTSTPVPALVIPTQTEEQVDPVREMSLGSSQVSTPSKIDDTTSIENKLDNSNNLSQPPKKKIQKNKRRCFKCNAKILLTAVECHCGYKFCNAHRLAEAHDCDHDYQSTGRQQLAEANPPVRASKLEKI